MRLSLTDRFVSGAKATDAPQVDYFDADTAGLALRVSCTGRKAWTFLYTSPRDGRRARTTLGTYPATSLATARRKALEARAHVEEGPDPKDWAAAQEAGAMTVGGLINSYLENHARPNLRSAAAIERRLKKNVLPTIGAVKLAALHRRDCTRVVDAVLRRGKMTEACRTFEDQRAMLRWAVARGDLDYNPAQGMRRPAEQAPRERVLTDDEIRTLWSALPKALPRSPAAQNVIRLCLITAQRVGEVAGMERRELDMKARTWTLPGRRTKNGREHIVPLSDKALEIIREALAEADGSAFLFPSGQGALPAHAVAKTITRALKPDAKHPLGRLGLEHFTCHDLRRSALTNFARLGISSIVAGAVANHVSVTKATVTLRVYQHYDHGAEKRAALDMWADRLNGIIAAGAEVVPIRGARR